MADTMSELEALLRDRRAARPEGSYSVELLCDVELVQRKIVEEAFEVTLELGRHPQEPSRLAEEAADLVFHLLVGLVGAEVSWSQVLDELDRRRQ